jgi:hypothetical protein
VASAPRSAGRCGGCCPSHRAGSKRSGGPTRPIGSLISPPIIERVERRTLIIGSALALTVLGLAFGFSNGAAAILVAGLLYTAAGDVFSNAYHVYQRTTGRALEDVAATDPYQEAAQPAVGLAS